MSDLKPDKDAPPPVDIVDQIIVGFNPKLGCDRYGSRAGQAQRSSGEDTEEASRPRRRKDAFFAIAVIRYDGEKSFADLKKQLESDERIAWVERNAPIVLTTGFNDPLHAQQWALTKLGTADPWTVAPPPRHRTIVAIVDLGLLLLDGVNVHADLGGSSLSREGASTWTATALSWPAPLQPGPTTPWASPRPFPTAGTSACCRCSSSAPTRRPTPPMPPSPLRRPPTHRLNPLITWTRWSSMRAGTLRRAIRVWRPCGTR